jgi:DNA-binding winged helix-turn-helix (wHTH) protein
MGHEAVKDAIYTFGPFRFDARKHKLTKEGKEVDLDETPTQVLLALVEQAGELVSKEDLLKKVWGGTAVTDDSFYQHISVLRRTLGDGRKDNNYIMTIPRKGYRFVAPVEVVGTANGVPAGHRKPDIIRLLPPGDSGYRTVVLGADEDHVVDRSGEVVRLGDPVIDNLVDEAGNITHERTGTIVRARDGSNELLVEDLAGEITGVLKIDRAGNIFVEYVSNDDDDYDFLTSIVEEGSSNIINPFEEGSGNIIVPPEAGTGGIAPKGLKRSGPRRKRSGASRG